MKFYLCHTPEGRKRLVTRQDEAKKLDKTAEPIDIPVDQAGIKQGYEELFDRIYDLEQGESLSSGETEALDSRPEVSPPPAPTNKKAPKPEDGAEALIDWIFDHATSSEISDVFSGLSCRYNELIKRERENGQPQNPEGPTDDHL